MTDTPEEIDPQDTAVLSDDMAEPAPVQETVKAVSVYDALVRIAQTHGKLYRTNGKHADTLRFDLTAHAVFVGNTFIVSHGKVKMPVLETSTVKIDLTGLPWLAEGEKELSPTALYRNHYLSRPNGSEKYMLSNFRAKDIDEMTDDEIAQGETRSVARVRLEAWILCAALDGTLERYVTSQPNWKDGNWWWSPDSTPDGRNGTQLVIKTEWWKRANETEWVLGESRDGRYRFVTAKGREVAKLALCLDEETGRTVQMARRSLTLAQSLAEAAFKLQLRTKCFDLDPLITDINRLVEYVRTGRQRTA